MFILTFTIIGVLSDTLPPKEITIIQEYVTIEECHIAQDKLKKSVYKIPSTTITSTCIYKE